MIEIHLNSSKDFIRLLSRDIPSYQIPIMTPGPEFQYTILLVEWIVSNINGTVGFIDHRWIPFDRSVPILNHRKSTQWPIERNSYLQHALWWSCSPHTFHRRYCIEQYPVSKCPRREFRRHRFHRIHRESKSIYNPTIPRSISAAWTPQFPLKHLTCSSQTLVVMIWFRSSISDNCDNFNPSVTLTFWLIDWTGRT